MNRWHAAIIPLAALGAYVLLSALADGFRAPFGGDVVFVWWHPMVAVFVASVAAIAYCAVRGVRCDGCRRLSKEVDELSEALTADRGARP